MALTLLKSKQNLVAEWFTTAETDGRIQANLLSHSNANHRRVSNDSTASSGLHCY